MEDTIRVIRVIEYVGPRTRVEETLEKSYVRSFRDLGSLQLYETFVSHPEVIERTTLDDPSTRSSM